jgi:hypothetical protein
MHKNLEIRKISVKNSFNNKFQQNDNKLFHSITLIKCNHIVEHPFLLQKATYDSTLRV